MMDKLKQTISIMAKGGARARLLLTMLIGGVVSVLAMPHDSAIATLASIYIFPSIVSGFAYGVTLMATYELWKLNLCEQVKSGDSK